MLEKLRRRIEEVRWADAAELSWWVKFVRRQVRLVFYVLRELVRDKCPQQAAALTFTTLLSIVPLLAVAFSFFHGLAAMEGLEERARDAILRALLAGPLMEGIQRPGEEGRATLPDDVLGAMTPQELLAEAGRRRQGGEPQAALQLYLVALNGGADAAQVRDGVSRVYLAGIDGPAVFFRRTSPDARARYLTAAGLDVAQMQPRKGPKPEGEDAYRRALDRGEARDYAAAQQLLQDAEGEHFDPLKTRLAAGRLDCLYGERLAEEGDDPLAAEQYKAALLSCTDALILGSLYGSVEQVSEALDGHRRARTRLGDALFTLGKRDAELYQSLRERPEQSAAAEQALQAAARRLTDAADLLSDPSGAHALLGDLLWDAGQQDAAREHYTAAIGVAAAQRISESVADRLRTFLDQVGTAGIGIVGSLFLLATAASLLHTIETTLNHIWKVAERRAFWIKFTSYCTLIWLGPALIGAGIWAQEKLGYYIRVTLGDMPVLGSLVGPMSAVAEVVLPFVALWLALVALYKFLPHTHVKFSSVAWGAVLAAVLLQLVRPLFSIYVLSAVKYEGIYGSLGAAPVFLLWIWLLWLIVLFGAEVSFTIQSVGLLRFREKLSELSEVFIDRYLAARVMLYVAREFWQTGRPISSAGLAETLQISAEEACDAAQRLVRLGLLTPVGEEREEFHPARDLSRLKLSEVLSITDRFRDESRSSLPQNRPYEDRLEAVFRSAIEGQERGLKDMTFRDLLVECEGARGESDKGTPPGEQ